MVVKDSSRRQHPAHRRRRLLLWFAIVWLVCTVIFSAGSWLPIDVEQWPPVSVLMGVSLLLGFLFFAATVAGLVTFAAPPWLQLIVGVLGIVCAGIGVYYVITVPEGILTPLLIPLGIGVIVGAAGMAIARRRGNRDNATDPAAPTGPTTGQ